MKRKTNALSFFSAMFLTFGITSLNFDDLSFDENIRGYVGVVLGIILAIALIVIKTRENQST